MPIPKRAVFICLILVFLTPTASNVMGSLRPTDLPRPQRTGRPDIRIVTGQVRPGDAISVILDPYLPLETVFRLNRQSKDVFSLQNIKPGQPYEILVESGRMTRFEYRIRMEEKLVICKQGQTFSITREPVPARVTVEKLSATIRSSLSEAVRASGGSSVLAGQLAGIFAWDIDFHRDIRPGDQFSILAEKRFIQGRFIGWGNIRAASFTCRGRTFQAFRHQGADNIGSYYDGQGRSLYKAFLKAPLEYSRISSKFNLRRMHPILKEIRVHPGVDYAAPEGTPVKAVGDGTVSAMGFSRTTGNQVTINHANGYITRYYHLSGFAKGLKKGRDVAQGDLIGYVGQTGYATGPHLCFRMTKDGRPVDPLTHRFPPVRPIPPAELAAFLDRARALSGELASAASGEPGPVPSA